MTSLFRTAAGSVAHCLRILQARGSASGTYARHTLASVRRLRHTGLPRASKVGSSFDACRKDKALW